MKEINEITDLYTTILAWAFLPQLLTSFIHGLLRFLRILRPTSPKSNTRQRQIIHTTLLLIYAASEFYRMHESLPQSHFSTLNVSPRTMISDLKPHYRRLSLKYHPDKSGSFTSEEEAEEHQNMYMRIRKAYDTLSDPLKASVYTRMGAVDCNGSCRTYKEWLIAYATESAVFWMSLIIAMGIFVMMTRNARATGLRMAVILIALGIELGIVTGGFSSVTQWPVPAFYVIAYLKKAVLVYTMLSQQLSGIWTRPNISVQAFLDRLAQSSQNRNVSMDILASRLFLTSEFNEKTATTLRGIMKAADTSTTTSSHS